MFSFISSSIFPALHRRSSNHNRSTTNNNDVFTPNRLGEIGDQPVATEFMCFARNSTITFEWPQIPNLKQRSDHKPKLPSVLSPDASPWLIFFTFTIALMPTWTNPRAALVANFNPNRIWLKSRKTEEWYQWESQLCFVFRYWKSWIVEW